MNNSVFFLRPRQQIRGHRQLLHGMASTDARAILRAAYIVTCFAGMNPSAMIRRSSEKRKASISRSGGSMPADIKVSIRYPPVPISILVSLLTFSTKMQMTGGLRCGT